MKFVVPRRPPGGAAGITVLMLIITAQPGAGINRVQAGHAHRLVPSSAAATQPGRL